MADYLSKLADAGSMLWSTLGYMERYWTIAGVWLLITVIVALARALGPERGERIILVKQEAPPAP